MVVLNAETEFIHQVMGPVRFHRVIK